MFSAHFRALWWLVMTPGQYAAIHNKVVDYIAAKGITATLIWDKNGASFLFADRENYDRFVALPSPNPEDFGL